MVLKNPDEYQKDKTIIYFVRHGDRINIPGSLPPHDFSLSKKGIKQAKEVANQLFKIKNEIDLLYTSSMKRAYETAVIIGKKINKKPIVLPNFEEVHKALDDPNFFRKDYWKCRREFENKNKIFNEILENNRGKVIVLVAHGRLNRMIIGKKLGLSYKKSNMFHASNGHLTRVRFKDKKIEYLDYVNSRELLD